MIEGFKFKSQLPLIFLLLFGVSTFHAQEATADETDNSTTAASVQFQKGQDAHERGKLTAALDFYEKALQLNPNFPEAEFQRGAALQQLGRDAQAETSFRRAANLHPDWPLPLVRLGALLVKRNELVEAETVLNQAVALNANDSSALVSLVELNLRAPNSAQRSKLESLLTSIKQNTDDKTTATADLWAARAALERTLNDLPAAQNSVARALQINPDNAPAKLERAQLALRANDLTAAQTDIDAVLSRAPQNVTAQKLRAQIAAAKAGNSDDIGELEQSLAANPDNLNVLGRLCELTRKTPAKALDYCRRAALLEPKNISHQTNLAAALVQARRFNDGILILQKILAVAPDDYAARANYATALYETKQFARAIPEYNKLLEAKPNAAVIYFFKATAHDNLGEYVEARQAYQQFLTLADANGNQLEIDKVKLRLPSLERQIKKGAGQKKPSK